MNEFETGVFNSSLIFNYLLRTKSSFTLYLEDGSKLNGTLLGWDADFLLIKEGKFLQMIQIKKILHLQAEFDQIVAVVSAVTRVDSAPSSLGNDIIDSTIKIGPIADTVSKFKPTLTEVKTPLNESEKTDSREKNEFKDKLDHLVRNW